MSIFSQVSVKKPKRSKFNMTHDVKLSGKMGNIIPMFITDVLPGDSFSVGSDLFSRLAPMMAPVMHRINCKTEWFFVPNRLLWDEWEKFITGGPDGTLTPEKPYILPLQVPNIMGMTNSLMDYMGYPVGAQAGTPHFTDIYPDDFKIDAMPFRAYQLVYNEYYRDQNLDPDLFDEDNPVITTGSGQVMSDVDQLLSLRNRCWEHDYFTSALPFEQRGPAVGLPIQSSGTIPVDISITDRAAGTNGLPWVRPDGTTVTASDVGSGSNASWKNGGSGLASLNVDDIASGTGLVGQKVAQSLVSSASFDAEDITVTGVTINELRRSIALQSFLENNARGGSRYIEQILVHFGVKSSDARLQRPEFLGGGKSPAVISEVFQTSTSTSSDTPLADMAGAGVFGGSVHGCNRFFEEHGFLIGVVTVLPRSAYQDGVSRMFQKWDKLDYAFPEFAHLGEQPVYQSELKLDKVIPPDQTFGYVPRYAEYKYMPSRVCGEFRYSLDFWHLGRTMDGIIPNLGSDFVHVDPDDVSRIFAVEDEDSEQFYMQIRHSVHAKRPLPFYGQPKIIG